MSSLINVKPSQLAAALAACIPAHEPVLITGAPGVGKTEIVKQACKLAGALLLLRHPVVDSPIDYKGLGAIVDGAAAFLPFGDLQALIDATELTVCFLDDLGQAAPAVQAAAMQLILERKINGHQVSDHVVFIAATNRKADRAGVSGILEPVKSRFLAILNLEPDLDEWKSWAFSNNVPTSLIAYITSRPDMLHDFQPTADITNSPCPRTVAAVGRVETLGVSSQALKTAMFAGAAGDTMAIEYMAFLEFCDRMPDPDDCIKNPATAQLPDYAQPSIIFAIVMALVYRATPATMPAIVTYFDRIEAETGRGDFSIMAMNDIMTNKPECESTKAAIDWGVAHQEVIL